MFTGNPDSFDFEGTVKIKMEFHKFTNQIVMHANNLTISNVKFGISSGTPKSLPNPSFDKERQFLTFQHNEVVETSKTYELEMNFRGPLKNDLKGFYLSSYEDKGHKRYVLHKLKYHHSF
jgi:hypothetical protein